MNKPLLYTRDEAAAILGVTQSVLNRLLNSGILLRIGERGSARVNGESVRHYLARQNGMPPDVKVDGYIYLIKFMHYHKIGLAHNVQKRLYNLTLPEPVTLIHIIPTNRLQRAEKTLHIRYAHLRGMGEWFNLTPKEVKEICSIKALLFD